MLFSITEHKTRLGIALVTAALLSSACATRLPPEERARLKAEKENAAIQKALSKIQPIGKDENRRLSKEEAYFACNQKAQGSAKAAANQVKLKQSLESNKSKGGGFSGGALEALAEKFEQIDAADLAHESTMNSCLIDYGFMKK